MVGEVFAGLSAFKTMFDLAKRLKDIGDSTTRNAVAIELQEKILTAQTQQAVLIERVGELEARVAEFETWDSDKQRYQLTEYGHGAFAYALKEDMNNGEPPHRICAGCYQKRQISILQPTAELQNRIRVYVCNSCKAKVALRNPPESTTQSDQPGIKPRDSWSPRG